MWLARWYSPGGRLKSPEVVHDITEIALGGLLRTAAVPEAVPNLSNQIDKPQGLAS